MSVRGLIVKLCILLPRQQLYSWCDRVYLRLDRSHVRRTRNIRMIPTQDNRRGGKYSYAEWAHVIGIFQTLICQQLPKPTANRILDVGCGTGILAIAADPFVQGGGQYVGIDISQVDLEFSRRQYASPYREFIHLDAHNPEYAADQTESHPPWPVEDESFDMITALSVWTHLREADASFYLSEVRRALKPTGKAIITFFILDEAYDRKMATDQSGDGQFHGVPKSTWVFDQVSYGSNDFRHPAWAEVPEAAIAIKQAGLNRLLAEAGLELVEQHAGNWKELPGVYFQDIVILQRAESKPEA